MNISKEMIEYIYKASKDYNWFVNLWPSEQEDILAVASDLAQYYEAEEQRRYEKEIRAERRRDI